MQKHHIYIVLALIVGILIGCLACRSMTTQTATPVAMDHTSMTHGSMQSSMDSMTAGLQNKSGDEFDKAFLNEMIIHHQGAIDMADLVLRKSNRPELKQLADNITAAQTKEIDQMETWLAEWYK